MLRLIKGRAGNTAVAFTVSISVALANLLGRLAHLGMVGSEFFLHPEKIRIAIAKPVYNRIDDFIFVIFNEEDDLVKFIKLQTAKELSREIKD